MVEILKQPQYQPMQVEKQVIIIWTASHGYLDDIPVPELHRFEAELFAYLDVNAPELLRNIKDSGQLPKDGDESLKTNVLGFKDQFKATLAASTGA
jgi:F-type H+/Na+-transporting ATPase subunit alpha